MKFYFAGVNHFDPLCRTKLREWLKHLKKTNGCDPSFVAVESCKKSLFRQRLMIEEFIKLSFRDHSFQRLPCDVLKDIYLSFGYEADSHHDIFEKADTLWLNDSITDDEGLGFKPTQRRVVYSVMFEECLFPNHSEYDLDSISECVWSFCIKDNSPPDFYKYDKNWYKLIQEKLDGIKDGWAILIVGADHAQDIRGSVFNLLEKDDRVESIESKTFCPNRLLDLYLDRIKRLREEYVNP